ncbi:ankyrin repeat domain-containing protein 39-like [Dysidea avara]|uniref:ankyrin repeat domain-containing protein 39-like n=1 Tax=Dysidea avara TaxID=196820 RepID=UPI0033180D07
MGEESSAKDHEKVHSLFETEFNVPKSSVTNVLRLGKPGGSKARLLLVTLSDEHHKHLVMKQASKLRATERWNNIYDGDTALHYASDRGHLEVVNTLLSSGANILATNYYGWTALHCASDRGHLEVVNTLLSSGANILATDNYQGGDTPLHLAAIYNRYDVCLILLQHGSSVKMRNKFQLGFWRTSLNDSECVTVLRMSQYVAMILNQK